MMSDDTDLIEAAKQGDNEAFDRLWARHRDKVFRSLLRACGGNPDTTHDVLQDALLNAFKALQQFRGDANFATWLYTIARRLCIRARRDLRPLLLAGRPAEHRRGASHPAPTD
jgi:RNA polymerase sigma-70 factor (ECF subfamily)